MPYPASQRCRLQSAAAIASLVVAMLLSSCRAGPRPDAPPPFEPAVTATYPDGRTIVDPRTAAAFVTAGGEVRWFDDIGRLVSHASEAGETPDALWVRDYEKELWLRADKVHYVVSPSLVTPRGSGIIALGSDEAAARLALSSGGRVLTFEELPDYLAAAAALDLLPPAGGGLELGGVLEADDGR